MMSAATNVLDVPCVPVAGLDGAEQVLTLPEVLRTAHALRGLSPRLLPVEREALLRLLESLTGALLRGQDPDDVAEERRLDPVLVDQFFAQHRALFDLADPDRPLLQEWHVGTLTAADEKQYVPVEQLHLRVVGESSATWGVTPELRDAADPAVLLLLLAISWFHGKPSNKAGASFYRPTSGAKRGCIAGAPSGGPRDTVFHLVGTSLAETLLLNVPRLWLSSPCLPAWLDQDHEPSPAAYTSPGTLWRATWTPNRAHVRWDGDRAVRFTRGLTQRLIPEVADTSGAKTEADRWKANAKAVCADDYCRATRPDPKKPGVLYRLHATHGLHSAEGFERWYRDDLGHAFYAWVAGRDTVLSPESTSDQVLSVAFHHEEGDTYGNRELSTWTELPLREYTLTGQARDAAQTITNHVTTITKAAARSWREGLGAKAVLPPEIRQQVYASLDAPVLEAVSALAADEAVDVVTVLQEMSRAARGAFVASSETWLTAATVAEVSIARAAFVRLTQVKEIA